MPPLNTNPGLATGQRHSNPIPGDEVVISGIAGRFPECDSVYELQDSLFNKEDLITDDDRRWITNNPEIPQRTGKLKNVHKFDASFFGMSDEEANYTDAGGRTLLETAYEAIVDAGLTPKYFQGSSTGVIIGACFCEAEVDCIFENNKNAFGLYGCSRSMLANRISSWLDIKGPSFGIDTACSSSMYALDYAFRAIRDGHCEAALVGTSNLCLSASPSLQFFRLGVTSADGRCKCFDIKADGYARSEAVSMIILQKKKHAKRVYGRIIHSKTNCDGFKQQGVTYPSRKLQADLLREIYKECGVSPENVAYVEAHGTGTQAGDSVEAFAIDEFFCPNRSKPLPIGSIKGNLGHSEAAAGLSSITKACIVFETGFIPPNINYTTPMKGAVEKGRIKVVTEKTPLDEDLIGVSSFGFGGANCHVLLERNKKVKSKPTKSTTPYLAVVSGRLLDSISSIFNDLESRSLDPEFIRLINDSHQEANSNHPFRGFILLSQDETEVVSCISREINLLSNTKRPLWFLFTEISEDCNIGRDLLKIRLFKDSIERCHQMLLPKGINVINIINNTEKSSTRNALNCLIRTAVIHIALVDTLRAVGVSPDFIIGHSSGELGSAYADGCLTAQQTIFAAYAIGQVLNGRTSLSSSALQISLLGELTLIIPHAVERSDKWICATTTQKLFSVEYLVDSILKTVPLDHLCLVIPQKATLIEMGSLMLPKNILTKLMKKFVTNITLFDNATKDFTTALMSTFGKLYLSGCDLNLAEIHPEVSFPVSRGTPMISPLIKWDHRKNRSVWTHTITTLMNFSNNINIQDNDYKYLTGHVVDGRNIFPAAGYLHVVWKIIGEKYGTHFSKITVVFEDVRFLRATYIPKQGDIVFLVSLQPGSGHFEILESDIVVVTGRVSVCDNIAAEQIELENPISLNDEYNLPLAQEDIYKELRIRGYNYNGAFEGLLSCDNNVISGEILWEDNWVTYLDAMLQLAIIQSTNRALAVPTSIRKLSINTIAHLESILEKSGRKSIKACYHKRLDIIKSGGVEIRGLSATTIGRKKLHISPVVEYQKFVPFYCKHIQTLHDAIRININLALENFPSFNLKIVELIEDAFVQPLVEDIARVLDDIAIVQAEISILKSSTVIIADQDHGIIVENKSIDAESDCFLIIGQELLNNVTVVQNALNDNGFLLSREKLTTNIIVPNNLQIITSIIVSNESLILLKKKSVQEEVTVVRIDDEDLTFHWLETVKEAMRSSKRIVLYSQSEEFNGILGFVNCIRREPGGEKVQCFLILDKSAPEFNINNEFYKKQLELNLAVNIFKKGQWGSYRYHLMEENRAISEHSYVSTTVRGDLSTLQWLQGPLSSTFIGNSDVDVYVPYYSSLNFRDIMFASDKLATKAFGPRHFLDCVIGFEFSGKTVSGRRVMGFAKPPGISTLLLADKNLVWDVPDSWTLQEAATVVVAYCTSLYALITIGGIRRGMDVLIHSGSGGVGQAAIIIALHFGCTVYTTVGTQEKRDFIKKQFPQIKDHQIGNSRDTSFEQLVMTGTKGRGVDLVLNSLSGDKLFASVRCLASKGRFLEIGKYDLMNDNKLEIENFSNEVSHHGIMIDRLFEATTEKKKMLNKLFNDWVLSGVVQPLPNVLFHRDEVEEAFRFMGAGKHIGKVLIEVKKEEVESNMKSVDLLFTSKSRFYCDPNMTYVLCGGLGGFGLEIADWLVLRGAKKVVLTSRKGVTTGYQAMRIRIWRSYGCTIKISTVDCTTTSGCDDLLQGANTLGLVAAIFNLAVVLKDALFENQTPEMFKESFAPKVLIARNLDAASRKFCPQLKHFVMFSSISCGRGNAGQTNYGMANSVMERICESRVREGLPGLAIQWGAIGEVGLVAAMQKSGKDIEIGGTLPQSIGSCLEVLDSFLTTKEPVVASTVVAEKRKRTRETNAVEFVAKLIGVRDIRTVSAQTTLPELGMDSMMAIEMKQGLERDFDIFLSAQEIRDLTFARLLELADSKSAEGESEKVAVSSENEDKANVSYMLLKKFGTEIEAKQPVINLSSNIAAKNNSDEQIKTVFLIPGIEGVSTSLRTLATKLKQQTWCLQLEYQSAYKSVEDIASNLFPHVISRLTDAESFYIVGYSLGSLIALQLAHMLEIDGRRGVVWLIDGAPGLSANNIAFKGNLNSNIETKILTTVIPQNEGRTKKELEGLLKNLPTFDEKLELCLKLAPSNELVSKDLLKLICRSIYFRLNASINYDAKDVLLESQLVLIKPTCASVSSDEEDYGLAKFSKKLVAVHTIEGNHASIVDNEICASLINDLILSL